MEDSDENILEDFFDEEDESKTKENVEGSHPVKEDKPKKENDDDKEAVVELKDEVKKAVKKAVKNKNSSMSDKIVEHLKDRLKDEDFIMSEHLDFSTSKRIRDMILMLEKNDGDWVEGRKTVDGFIIQCPLHNYAPMTYCYDCEHWVGGKNLEGVCKRDLNDIDHVKEKYDIHSAKEMEIKLRRESRLKDEERTDDSKEVQE